jgi:ATP-dependent metalloprotease
MGGRVSEEIFFGKNEVTTGCSDDMNKATQMIYFHVRSGMFDELTGYTNFNGVEGYAEGPEMRNLIDSSVKSILRDSYARVRSLLSSNKSLIEKISDELVRKETLSRDEILKIVGIDR